MGARILVVEDNPLNLKLIRDVLEFEGFDVLTAQSGEEGLAVASQERLDLVLMDLQLPGITMSSRTRSGTDWLSDSIASSPELAVTTR